MNIETIDKVFRNGVQVYNGPNLGMTATSLAANTTYSFTVKACFPSGDSESTSPVTAVTTRNKACRVESVTESGWSSGEGNVLTWTYGSGQTTVEDRWGKSETMMFDYSGHTVCVRDGVGNAVYGAHDNSESNKMHTLTMQSQMQSTVTNLIKNPDLEGGSIALWAEIITDSSCVFCDNPETFLMRNNYRSICN